jgi:polyisoprenoid-binding protein YceI
MIQMEAAIYRTIIAIGLVSLAALLAACGDQGSGTTYVPTSVATSVVVATPTLTLEPVASATAVPAVTPSDSSSSLSSSSPDPVSQSTSTNTVPLAESPPETVAVTGVIVKFTADSVARYRINEQLARLSLPNEAVGETQDIVGAIVFSADDVVVRDALTVRIGLVSLKSDEGRRDGYVRNNTLNTREFPDAFVAIKELRGLPWPLPSSGEDSIQLVTDTTIRGVTSSLEWEATVTFDGDGVVGTAQTSFPFSTFGLSRPRLALISASRTVSGSNSTLLPRLLRASRFLLGC